MQPEQSLMTFEGQQMQGAVKIMEKIASLTFQKIQRNFTAVDAQPTFDGGVLINVLGQLKVHFPYSSDSSIVIQALFLFTTFFSQKVNVHLFSSSLPCFDKCHEVTDFPKH